MAVAEAVVNLRGLAIVDTAVQGNKGSVSRAVHLQGGPQVTLRDSIIERATRIGISALDSTSHVRLESSVIRDTRSLSSQPTSGIAVILAMQARATLKKVRIDRSRTAGIHLDRDGCAVNLEDVVIRDTVGHGDTGQFGRGLIVGFGGTADVTRLAILRNRELGIDVRAASVGSFRDILVQGHLRVAHARTLQ